MRGCREEEVAAEQQETLEEDENLLSPDALCNVVEVPKTEACLENQPAEEQETCLPKEECMSGESDLIKDLSVDAIDCPDIGAEKVIIVRQNVEIQTSPKESVPQTKASEEETFEKSPGLTESTNVKANITEHLENSQQGPGEERSLRTTELNPQENAAQVLQKQILAEESVPNTEPQQEPDNAAEANDDEAEEVPSKSQPQVSTASGKKKKKKRKSKKKGGSLDNKNQQKDKENVDKSEKNQKPALSNDEVTNEPDTSVTETLKTPPSDQVSNEQDGQEPDQVDAVEPAENCSQKELITGLVCNKVNTEETINAKTLGEAECVGSSETIDEAKVELIKGDQNEEETLEREKKQLVKPTDSCSERKTLQESIKDHVSGEFEEGEPGPLENTDAVVSLETPSHMETPNDARREIIEDIQNEEETLETEKMAEAVEPTQSLSKRESFQEPVPDHVSDVLDKGKTTSEEVDAAISSETPCEARAEDVQNQEETLDTKKVGSLGSSEMYFLKEPFQELITDHVSDELREGKTIRTEESEEAVVSCEMPYRPETLNKAGVERTEDEQNKEEILEMPKIEPEAKEPTESLSHVESFEESITDCELRKDGGLLLFKVKEQESTNSPGPKTSHLKSELIEDPSEVDILIVDTRGENSDSGEVQTPPETVDETKHETTAESGSKDDHKPESHSPRKGDTDVDKPESKDRNSTPSHDDHDDDEDVAKSLAVDSDNADPTNIGLDIGPKANDGQPMPKIANEEEVVASCREVELKQNRTENEELNEDEAGSGNQSDSDRKPKGFNTENGQDGTENTNQADSKTETKDLEAAGVMITSQSSEEKETAEHPEPLNAQQDEDTGSSCLDPLAEQIHESSRKEAEGVDSPQPSHQDSNDEDDNVDDEGQSFDFDDLDTEVALESTASIIPEQEVVEKGLEVVIDGTNVGGSEMAQSNSETHKKTEDKPVDSGDEKVTVDEVNHLVTKADCVPQQDQNSLPPGGSSPKEVENVCEEKQNATKEKEKDLAVASEKSTENISASVKEGVDVIQQDLDSPKIVDQNVADKDAPPSGKDAKKSTKKGKGKGKEDCKMS